MDGLEYKFEEGTFFRNYINKVQESLKADDLEEFSKLTNDADRIKFVYELDIVHQLDLPGSHFKKNSEKALDCKNNGNKVYGKSLFGQAARYYSNGLMECPQQDGVLLATLHANRSACLYNMQYHRQAIDDINTALSLPYPEHLHHKVLERKARCHLAQNDIKLAVDSFKRALTSLDKSDLNLPAKQKKESDFAIMIELMTKTLTIEGEKKKTGHKSSLPIVPNLTNGKNEQYPSASNSVGFCESENEGRYAVANGNIQAGDVILIENSFCATLLYKYSRTHCQECFTRTANPFPCPNCTAVIFCSPKCRKIALNSYHKYECSFLGSLLTEGASIICCLAVRIITQRGIQYFLDIKSKLEKKSKDLKIYDASDYRTVYNLCKHESRRNTNDFFQRAAMSTILLRFLQNSKFFKDEPSRKLSDIEQYIGSLLLHNLQLLQFNAHEIAELQYDPEHPGDVMKGNSQFIGGGVFPTLALFNHSCEPGIVRYFSGSKIIVRAVKPISSGDIIAENYGPIYTQVEKSDRRLELKQKYWFECNCRPCLENWPLFRNMTNDFLPFKCNKTLDCKGYIKVDVNTDEFMFKCPKCNDMISIFVGLRSLNDTEALFKQGEKLMEERKYEDSLHVFLKIIQILNEVLRPPYRDFCLCQQKIRSNMLTLGNHYQPVTKKQI